MKLDFKKIWSILAPLEKRRAILMIILVILMAFAETAGVLSIMPFLSVLARPDVVQENVGLLWLYKRFSFADSHEFIMALGLASVTLVIASSLFKTITLHYLNRFTFLLRHSISARLLSRYLKQTYNFFLTNNPSELSRNVLSEVDQLQNGLIKPLSQLIAQGAVASAMMLILFVYDPWIAISAAAIICMLYGVIYILVRKRLGYTGRARQVSNGDRFQACNEVLAGIKDVKITGSVDTYQKKFNNASREYSRHQANAETLSQSPLYIVEVAGYTGLIVLALILIKQSGDISQVLPVLGLYGFATYRLLPSAQIMYRGFAQLRFSSAALDTVYDHLNLPYKKQAKSNQILAPKQEIRLNGVQFSYPSEQGLGEPILRDFDILIPAGTSTGIAGKSGAGKSTVMDVLLGLLQPQIGQLSVDGVEINSGNVSAWQATIGYVPQHIYLADASIAENIAFGISAKNIDMQAVKRAASAAQIQVFIENELPDSYQTKVGDRGVRLSGGQRQRVGIARALYRDPPVLFFDEATSALDSVTEAAVSKTIAKLSAGKTVVVIAHREASIEACTKKINLKGLVT